MEFDFDKWMGVLDEDNKADEYYADDEAYMYCDECDNVMVNISVPYVVAQRAAYSSQGNENTDVTRLR